MNFPLSRYQAILLETSTNLGASRRNVKDFSAVFFSFELGDITKHLRTAPPPRETVSFVSQQAQYYPQSRLGNIEGFGETELTVPLGASH